jgi:hypothetical protein
MLKYFLWHSDVFFVIDGASTGKPVNMAGELPEVDGRNELQKLQSYSGLICMRIG